MPCQLRVRSLTHPGCSHLKMRRVRWAAGSAARGRGDGGSQHIKKQEKSPRTGLCFLFSGERRHPQGLEDKASSMCCSHTPRASRGQKGGGAQGTLARGEVATSSQATPPIGMRPEQTMGLLEDRASGLPCHRSPPSLQPHPVLKHCIW